MIEDVTTSGKSMEETVPKVRGAADVTIVGLSICTTNHAMVKLLSMTRSRLQSTHTMSSMVQNKEELQ